MNASVRRLVLMMVLISMIIRLVPEAAMAAGSASQSDAGLNQGQQYLPTDFTDVGQYSVSETARELSPSKPPPTKPSFFCTLSGDVSQRLETNVFQTSSNPQPDYAFRVNPKVHAGYQIIDTVHSLAKGCYSDYSVLKDVFAFAPNSLNLPTNQTVGVGAYHDLIPMDGTHATSARLDCLVRSIWNGPNNHQSDILPSLYLVRRQIFRYNAKQGSGEYPYFLFGTTQLQMRSGLPFEGATHELDPIYTIGVYLPGVGGHTNQINPKLSKKGWNCTMNASLFTNYREPPFHHSHPRQGNDQIIADLVLDHPLLSTSVKHGGLSFYTKAEPVWNFDSNRARGLSGFDFRFFMGLRYSFSRAPS